MEEYLIKIELMSDAIFGSGYSIPGFLDSDILYDDLGLPYIHGKTFKGKMGEMAYILIDMLERAEDSRGLADIMKVKRDKLFGVEGQVNANALKFSSCEVSRNLREYIRFYINDAGISPLEILDALTHVETHTAIEKETGIAKENSLRKHRVINRGITLYSTINSPKELDEDEKILLSSTCSLLRHLGAFETKGKGVVEVTLWEKNKEITKDYIQILERRVKTNV